MDKEQIESKLIEYVKTNTFKDIQKLTPKTLLFKEGIFDSMAFVLLIDYLEMTFRIKPSDDDLVEENFESIEAISNYISRKSDANLV
jgi:acyl carrier protein